MKNKNFEKDYGAFPFSLADVQDWHTYKTDLDLTYSGCDDNDESVKNQCLLEMCKAWCGTTFSRGATAFVWRQAKHKHQIRYSTLNSVRTMEYFNKIEFYRADALRGGSNETRF